MTDFERDVSQKLGELSEGIKSIKASLANDYRFLHGNGQPGLIERVKELEDWRASMNHRYGTIVGAIAFIINTAIAIYAVVKK